MARVGGAEERGRPTRKRSAGKDRDQETLGMMAESQSRGKKGSTSKTGHKGKRDKGNSIGKVKDIRSFFEEKAGGKSTSQEKPGNEQRGAGSKGSAPGKSQE